MMTLIDADENDMLPGERDALARAKSDALETAEALENLVQGIQAVKRILERPVEELTIGQEDTFCKADVELISSLSDKLIGVLGSDLIGLLNAAQMTKSHTKLCVDDNASVIQDLHRAKEETQNANDRADRMEETCARLRKEKRLLVHECRALRGHRRVLIQEVKTLRDDAKRSQEMHTLRLIQDAVEVHESVLNHKTFTSGFAAIDPPGAVTPKDDNMENNELLSVQTRDDVASSMSNKENEGRNIYVSRKENPGNAASKSVLTYAKQENRYSKLKTASTPIEGIQVTSESKPKNATTISSEPVDIQPMNVTPTAKSKTTPNRTQPPKSSSRGKPRGLRFSKGFGNSFSNGLGRFKNVLQEASDQILYPEGVPQQQNQRPFSPKDMKKKQQSGPSNNEENQKPQSKQALPTNSDYDAVDDEATKSTKSCSFDMDRSANTSSINRTMNLDSSLISTNSEGMPNDLAFQISIDEGVSFLDTSRISHQHNGDINTSCHFVITPETSPVSDRSMTDLSKPLFDSNVLRTLSIPNGNGPEESSGLALKPRIGSFPQ